MTDPDQVPDEWTANDVESNGARLRYYRSGGDGPPLVVAHGITSSARAQLPLLRAFTESHDVIAYDARGHGRSDAPPAGYAVADQVADLVGLVESLSLANPILYGHSIGGTTVAATAASQPDLPRAVVLEDPALMLHAESNDGVDTDPRPHDEPDGNRGVDLGSIRTRIEGPLATTPSALVESEPELRELVADGREELARLLARAYLNVDERVGAVLDAGQPDPEAVFPDVAAPTLILKADADSDRCESDRELASLLPDGRLVHVDGAGHCVRRDEYEAAVGAVRAFLDER
ncbi:alpha/beta fold hydrolase [Natrialbaceae archaeon A-arb3/5]